MEVWPIMYPKPYVYKCTHKSDGTYYFGYRSANKLPADQDLGFKYFTSSDVVAPRFSEFDFEIVGEFADQNEAHSAEQRLIREHWDNPLLLNKALFPVLGRPNTPAQRQRARERMLSDANPMKDPAHREAARLRNLGKKHSESTKAKMSATRTGREIKKRPGTQVGVLNHAAKHYVFTSPEGIKHNVIASFSKFCKEHGLGEGSCYDVAKGRKPDYKGWTISLL